MGVPAVGQTYLFTFRGDMSNQVILNTFMYNTTGIGTAVTTQDIINDCITFMKTANNLVQKFLACMPSEYTLVQEWGQVVFPARFAKQTFTDGNIGTSGFSNETANQATTIERRGDLANRASVGSLHLVCPTAISVASAGIITDVGYLSALQSFANQMLVTLTGAVTGCTLVPVLFNTRNPGVAARRITQAIPTNEIRVMRRRTVRLGI